MKELHNDGDRSVKPDVKTYGTLINALSKSDDPSMGELVDKYLCEMKQFDIHPDNRVYVNTIKAWTRCNDGHAKDRISALKKEIGRLGG